MNRKPLILAVLLLIFALSLGYSIVMTPRQERVAASPAKSGRPRVAEPAAGGGVARLETALLAPPPAPFPEVKRNLFRTTVAAPAPPPTKPAPPPVAVSKPPAPVEPPVPVIVPPVETPARALARFTFLGYLKRGTDRSIFLSSAGEIFVVHPGDRFGRRQEFKVVDLSATQMVIRQGDDPREIVVHLVEQAPLSATQPRGKDRLAARPGSPAALPSDAEPESPPENDPTTTEGSAQ